MASDCVNLKVC